MSCIDCRGETSSAPSCGWRCVYSALDVLPAIDRGAVDVDRVAAATRGDRLARYRRKHELGVSS